MNLTDQKFGEEPVDVPVEMVWPEGKQPKDARPPPRFREYREYREQRPGYRNYRKGQGKQGYGKSYGSYGNYGGFGA